MVASDAEFVVVLVLNYLRISTQLLLHWILMTLWHRIGTDPRFPHALLVCTLVSHGVRPRRPCVPIGGRREGIIWWSFAVRNCVSFLSPHRPTSTDHVDGRRANARGFDDNTTRSMVPQRSLPRFGWDREHFKVHAHE